MFTVKRAPPLRDIIIIIIIRGGGGNNNKKKTRRYSVRFQSRAASFVMLLLAGEGHAVMVMDDDQGC